MNPAGTAVARPTGLPTRSFSNAILWFAVFLGGFVFVEPAPYEYFLAAIIPLWMILGLSVPRAISPLVVLMTLFLAGGIIAAAQAVDLDEQPIYMAVSGFLALSACFYAALIGQGADRLDTIVGAWISSALLTAGLGILGYFGLTGEMFVKFGRAAGGFQDPNVFGPFLIFPFIVLVRRALTHRLGGALANGTLALILFAGIFLSFSRATWGLAVLTALMMGIVLFLTERSPSARMRYVGVAAVGLALIALLLAAALSLPAVADLFQQRAQIIQEYDGGRFGRFERYALGFNLMLDHPLGIGSSEFGRMFGEDEHNIWLKTITTYGWLGFVAFSGLVVWTLLAAFPLMFRTGPIQVATQAAYIVFAGHIVMATVIDIDHWRHVYLLFGLLWGAIAADRQTVQTRLVEQQSGAARFHPSGGVAA